MNIKELKALFTTTVTRTPRLERLKKLDYKILFRKYFDNSILTIYENGLVSYETHSAKTVYGTVFHADNLKWQYSSVVGTSFTVPESEYENMDAVEVLRFIGEERLQHNTDSREIYRAKTILDAEEHRVAHPNEKTPDFSNDLVDYFDQLDTYTIREARKIEAEQKINEALVLLQEALDSLTDKQAEVIKCRYYEQLTQEATATKIGIERVSVQDRERQALKKMRKKFKNYKYLPSIR